MSIAAAQVRETANLISSIARDGGARRDRTDDLMLAKHPLYQLSYGPLFGAAQESLSLSVVYEARVPKEW